MRSGFTLLELLVVTGIITLVAGMSLPAVGRARREARVTQCQNNIRQLAIGLIAYSSSSKGRFPPNVTSPPPAQVWSDDARIGSYVPLPPSGVVPDTTVYVCPEDDLSRRSYAMNLWASSKIDNIYVTTPPKGERFLASTKHADKLILLIESWSYVGSATAGYSAQPAIGGTGEPGSRFGANSGLVLAPAGRCGTINSEVTFARHRRNGSRGSGNQAIGRTAVAFADGHVSMLSNDAIADYETGKLSGECIWSLLDLYQ